MEEHTPAALSHREAYNKHLTHLVNVQQNKALSSIQRSFDKDCEDQLTRHNHEALQLRRKLKKLQKDKTYYRDNTFNKEDEAGPSDRPARGASAKQRGSAVGLRRKGSMSASDYEDDDELLADAAKPKEVNRGARNPNAAVSDKWQDNLRKTAMLEEAILHLKHAHMVKDTSMLPSESKFNALLNPDRPASSKPGDKEKLEKQKSDHRKALEALTRGNSPTKEPPQYRRASLPTPKSSGLDSFGMHTDKAQSFDFHPSERARMQPPPPDVQGAPKSAQPQRAPKLGAKSYSLDETGRRGVGSAGADRRMSSGRRGSGGGGRGAVVSAPAVDVGPRGSDSGSKQRRLSGTSSGEQVRSARGSRKWSLDEHIPKVIPEQTEKENTATPTREDTHMPRMSLTPEPGSSRPSSRPTSRPSSGRRDTLDVDGWRSSTPRGSLSRRGSGTVSSLSRRASRKFSAHGPMDEELLARYAELIQKSLNEADPNYKPPTIPGMVPKIERDPQHVPGAAAKRSQKRRIMQLEDMLNSLPSFKKKQNYDLTPAQVLACSYLRLSKNNIMDCEAAIRALGEDPGVHVHMTQEEAEEYFVLKDKLQDFNRQLLNDLENPDFKIEVDADDFEDEAIDTV